MPSCWGFFLGLYYLYRVGSLCGGVSEATVPLRKECSTEPAPLRDASSCVSFCRTLADTPVEQEEAGCWKRSLVDAGQEPRRTADADIVRICRKRCWAFSGIRHWRDAWKQTRWPAPNSSFVFFCYLEPTWGYLEPT